MKLRILPNEKITISTKRNDEEIIACLTKLAGRYNGSRTKFERTPDHFVIQRILRTNSHTNLIGSGTIHQSSEQNFVKFEISVKDNYLIFFAILWYTLNSFIFLFGIYVMFRDKQFQFFIFLPLLFILIGYGFTTLTIQGAIDELINDIIKSLK